MNEQKAVTTSKAALPMTARGVSIDSMESLFRFSDAVFQSGLAPTSLKNSQAIMIAIEMGLEVGLPPMAALQNIAVVNGRPTIWGDAQLGIVRSTGELEEFSEWYEVAGAKTSRNPTQFSDDVTAVCRVKRIGFDAMECAFSVADAKRANLWGKAGPWTQYPARMLRYRARSFALRDNFGDALRGLLTTEEVRDSGDIIDVTPAAPAGPVFKRKKAEVAPLAEPEAPKQDPIVEVVTNEVAKQADQVVASVEQLLATEPQVALSETQSALAKIVTEAGGNFDSFIRACVSQDPPWMSSADAMTYSGFDSIPDAVCSKFIGAKRGVATAVKREVEKLATA